MVQGYEIPAMRGAEELLAKATIVVCEGCFFRKLYDGQPLLTRFTANYSFADFVTWVMPSNRFAKLDGRGRCRSRCHFRKNLAECHPRA